MPIGWAAEAQGPGPLFSLDVTSSSPEEAFANTLDKETVLTLSTLQRVYYSVEQDRVLDNRGAVSIRLLPEPATGTLLLFDGLARFFLARRSPVLQRAAAEPVARGAISEAGATISREAGATYSGSGFKISAATET